MTRKASQRTAKKLSANKEKKISREFLQTFNVDDQYGLLVEESPVLMTVLHAAACKEKIEDLEV